MSILLGSTEADNNKMWWSVIVGVDFTHAIAAGRLPLIHRDPFDRMLVAQARCEGLTLVTRDPHCQQYEVAILRA